MSLPVLHPEQLLGTRHPRGVFSELKHKTLRKVLKKHYSFKSLGCNKHELLDETVKIMEGFIKSKDCFTVSETFVKQSMAVAIELAEEVNKKILQDEGGEICFCLLKERSSTYYRIFKHPEGVISIHFSQVSGDKVFVGRAMLSGPMMPRIVFQNALEEEESTDAFLLAEVYLVLGLCLAGHRINPYIVPVVDTQKSSAAPEKESLDTGPRGTYSIPIKYVTPATFKDRQYLQKEWSRKEHTALRWTGPGRLNPKKVVVRESSFKRNNIKK